MPVSKSQTKASRKWEENNKERVRYKSGLRQARSFIRINDRQDVDIEEFKNDLCELKERIEEKLSDLK